MKRVVIGGLMCVVGLAGPAVAADLRLAKSPEVMAPAWSWTGGYIGLHGGYGWGSADHSFHPSNGVFAPASGSFGPDIDGGLFGFQTGWNWQIGNVVVGLEGTTAWSGIEGKDAAAFTAYPNATYKTEVESLSTFVARLGFANGGWLVYGKAGAAYGEVKSTLTDTGGQYFRRTSDHIGWTVGLGVDYALTPNWILGLEYNYIDLGDQHYGGIAGLDYKDDITVSTVLARLSYKFGAGGNPLATAILGSATPGGLWNGLYLGVHGGYGWGTADHTLYAGSLVAASGSKGFDFDGGVFGGQAGYMTQLGNWVLGTEATFAWAGAKKTGDVPAGLLNPGATARVSSELDWLATTTIRLGYTWGPWQLYGKGGTAFGESESKATIVNGGGNTFAEKNDHIGWTIGGGLEYSWGNWLAGIEYNYVDLGDQKYGGLTNPAGDWLSYETELSFSTVLARLSYKFSPTPAPVIAKY
ncbi:MAG: porin family protein [Methylacidiphilales bacterium]|nr:porin family protein [Candidatus Methylacidiphilales bacterium]